VDLDEATGNFEVISGSLSENNWEIACTATSGKKIFEK